MSVLDTDPREQVQVLAEDGSVVEGATVPDLSEEEFVELYRTMKLARHFDQRAVSLQRQGRMGTYPPLAGQEAAQVGSAMALDEQDWLIPSYREHAASYVHGLPLEGTLRYWMGDERGNKLDDLNIFPVAVPIASQVPHAAGLGMAANYNDTDEVFMCYFGDGATSEGDFHEGLNFGGVFDTPTVFFCNNNQWAISVPREKQTASETIAQKAIAYGIDGVQVDGMDPLAVYKVAKAAVDRARNGEGDKLRPTLIEAVQYRYGAHTTADDPSVYRQDDEVEEWKAKDPIPRMETFLRDRGVLDDERVDEITESIEDEVAAAIETAEGFTRPTTDSMFEHVYADMPERLREQKAYLDRLQSKHGDEELLE